MSFGYNKRGDGKDKYGPPHNTRSGGQTQGRFQSQGAMDVTGAYSTSSSDYGAGYQQQQAQGHIFRQAEASKQMVYEVYGNTIAMLEEVEAREMTSKGHKPLPRSDIHMVSQGKYDYSTCLQKLDTELLLFEKQLKYCDKEIRQEVRDELTQKTIMWNSIRERQNVPQGVTDKYVGKMIEVLKEGRTEHPKDFYETPTISESGMRGVVQNIMQGQHMQSSLDDDYRQNPDKKAHAPNIRSSDKMDLGAERVARNNPGLSQHVSPYNNSLR